MQKKLTISIDEQVYEGLQRVVGPGRMFCSLVWTQHTCEWRRMRSVRRKRSSGPRLLWETWPMQRGEIL